MARAFNAGGMVRHPRRRPWRAADFLGDDYPVRSAHEILLELQNAAGVINRGRN